jgi:hypothetical protein
MAGEWRVDGGTSLRFDMASYVRGSPGREASARASLARSPITYCGDGDGALKHFIAAGIKIDKS